MHKIVLSITILFVFSSQAADRKFPVSSIPLPLLKNANVVKRMEQTEFTILNPGASVLKSHYALTILNENGRNHAALEIYYDKLRQVPSIEGILYDALGNEIKKLKNKDIGDQSAIDDNNLMEDSRKKVHNFYYGNYPYTIEYIVEQKFNTTFFSLPGCHRKMKTMRWKKVLFLSASRQIILFVTGHLITWVSQ